MEIRRRVSHAVVVLSFLALGPAVWAEEQIDAKKLLSQPKAFVGSDVCRNCHLEHYDAWKRTLHSRMLQDAGANQDAIITEIDPELIKADLIKIQDKLKVPVEEIYIPKVEDIHYTIGSQWKQRFLIEKDGTLFISPIQFNAETGRWVNYHEHDWEKRPWLKKCGGCHATGVDLDQNTFKEPGVGCEACHGPASHHAALPKTELFEKRAAIVNPGKLTAGVAVQICGSCHNRGKSTKVKGSSWPVGYRPGKALTTYYKSTSYEGGDVKHVYANEFSKGHHQQYIDWKQSAHYREGVTCLSCHYVHQLGNPVVRAQTRESSGDKTCLSCHEMVNKVGAHSVHSSAKCVACHMPRIAKSAESGDIHSHVFVALLPKDTLANPDIPNSCQTCHKHKDEDLKDLQRRYDELTTRTPATPGTAAAPLPVPVPASEG
ncbi:MAG: multiheme c-type cytochrome [Pseudomonadota bacterium]|nr:multiheme c-type cytochrome [Pseudomonadota bacterium]